jgi:hypothetical protein
MSIIGFLPPDCLILQTPDNCTAERSVDSETDGINQRGWREERQNSREEAEHLRRGEGRTGSKFKVLQARGEQSKQELGGCTSVGL